LGPISKISNIYTQETDYSTSMVHSDKKL